LSSHNQFGSSKSDAKRTHFQINGSSQPTTFTKVLSVTVSQDLSNALAFHSKHLQVRF